MSEVNFLAKATGQYSGMAVGRWTMHKLRKSLSANSDSSMLICKQCSQKLIPGKTCTFKVEKSRNKKYRNCIAYKCLICSQTTRISGAEKIAKKQELTPRTPKLSLTQADIQKIVHSIPSHFRTLETPSPRLTSNSRNSSESKQIDKKSLLDSFFSSKEGNNLYSLFH